MIKLQQVGSNQNVIETGAYTFFFSYETCVAGISFGTIGYWKSTDYMPNGSGGYVSHTGKVYAGTSQTTEGHINRWLKSCGVLPEKVKVVSQDTVNHMLGGV